MKDITGRNPAAKKRGKQPVAEDKSASTATEGLSAGPPGETAVGGRVGGSNGGADESKLAPPARRKAPTDSKNAAFEEWLRGRRPRDFLAEQARLSDYTQKHTIYDRFLQNVRKPARGEAGGSPSVRVVVASFATALCQVQDSVSISRRLTSTNRLPGRGSGGEPREVCGEAETEGGGAKGGDGAH